MNKHIINLWTKIFNNSKNLKIDILEIFNIKKNNENDFLYWISFWNQFCENLNIELNNEKIDQLIKLSEEWIELFYNTSIITLNNYNLVIKNINKLINIKNINFVINDLSIIDKLKDKNIILWLMFYKTRILVRNNILKNIIIPKSLENYINIKEIQKNQKYVYENTFDNEYYQKFLIKNKIKWIIIDIFNGNEKNLENLNINIYKSIPYSYVMSWRNCITNKIHNNLYWTWVTENCNKECYLNSEIITNYKNNILWKNLYLIWNTIFTKNNFALNSESNNFIYHFDNI